VARHVEFAQVINFRDLGGYSGHDGCTVQWGQLYRSGHLGKLAGEEWEKFLGLGISTVVDLRYPFEIERRGRVPVADSLAYHNLSIEQEPYYQADLGPEIAVVEFLSDKYLEVTRDGAAEIRKVLEIIATAHEPLVFHCAAGKDRTGIIAALVLSILGVSEQDIIEDFALTGLATQTFVTEMRARRPETDYLWHGYGQAPAELMRLFLNGLKAEYGSVEAYLTGTVGLTQEHFTAMRKRLLA
jgi:protein-tyrosine phosphatase